VSLFARTRRDALYGSETRSVSFQDVWGSDTEYRRDGAVEPASRAVRLDAVFSCVRLIGTTFAQIPWDVYRDGSKDPVRPTPTLISSPSSLVLPSAWRYQLAVSLALWGNAYGIVSGRDRLGYPAGLEWLSPERVRVQRHGGRVEYLVDGSARADVFHVQFQPMPGEVVGMAPLEYSGLVELGREAQAFGRKWFTEGATPSAILYSEDELEPEDARRLAGAFVSAIRRRRRPAVLGAGLRYEQVSVSAGESQFLETIRENRAQIATVFGVPPEMVGASVGGGGSITYANREQRSQDLLTFCLNGYLTAAQDALTAALPRGQVARPTTAALLRSDLLTRYQAHEIGIRARILTPNEARDLEDRPPLPGGDEFPLLPGQTPTGVDGRRAINPREIAELIQKVYLGVGVVITAEEARELANAAGADFVAGLPDGLGVPSPNPTPEPTSPDTPPTEG
jgi:HK97 family phage portal protein